MNRLLRLVGFVAVLLGSITLPGSLATAQEPSCADYSSAAAAQFALEINASLAGALDPDGNGIACDHEGSSGNPTPSSTTLQLPTESADAPAPANQVPPATVDVIDQQPTTSTTQQSGTSVLTGRIGDTQPSFAAVHGAPIEELPSDTNPSVNLRVYTPPATAFDLYTVDWNDQVVIVVVVAEDSWDGTQAAGIMDDYLPADITTLPNPEVLPDGSLLIPVFSNDLSTGITAEMMSQAGLPGVPGDMYVLLFTDGADRVVEIELGIGNGSDIREDAAAGVTPTETTSAPPTTAPLKPTPTPETTTSTTDAATFLQQARAEVTQYQGEITELRTIIGAGTFTEAETQRLSEIIVGWMAIDTSLPSAPPEHSAIATQLQQVRGDLANVGSTLFFAISSGDTSGIQTAADLLTTVETNLTQLDQQLAALGF